MVTRFALIHKLIDFNKLVNKSNECYETVSQVSTRRVTYSRVNLFTFIHHFFFGWGRRLDPTSFKSHVYYINDRGSRCLSFTFTFPHHCLRLLQEKEYRKNSNDESDEVEIKKREGEKKRKRKNGESKQLHSAGENSPGGMARDGRVRGPTRE